MKKILLISPIVPELTSDLPRRIKSLPFLENKALILPLHIATIAALTPDEIEVDLWDEPVHGQLDESTELPNYDLVGITGYTAHLPRAKAISQMFRKRSIPVAVGGSGVSAAPKRYRDDFDILFIGEAELTWPKFIADWKAGSYREEYRQITKPDISLSPLPRWDSIEKKMKNYLAGAVQTTRGCPFDCEFCDVIYLFGRRSRHKPIDRVLQEVVTLQRFGMERIFFSDDNFVGNPRYTKDLLRELIPLNNSFRKKITFSTQLSINVAKDDELLQLLADANFGSFFIGIETPNKESLRETNKFHNLHANLVEDCRKIQSYGLPITATMIVGFDHDTPEIFDQHFEFIQEACLPNPGINILGAMAGTRLWNRLRKEGRLLRADRPSKVAVNIIPKGMTRAELFSGYLDLLERTYNWQNFAARVKGMVSGVKRQPKVPKKKLRWKRFFQALRFLRSVDKDARRAIFDIRRHTRKHAPFMMDKVFSLIATQYLHVAKLQSLRETLCKQISLEESVDIEQFIDRTDVLVPEGFKTAYKDIFEEIHKHVHLGLK
ncbi:MAG: radical SAM protein, partial [Candidatus Poribacteria bacterium]